MNPTTNGASKAQIYLDKLEALARAAAQHGEDIGEEEWYSTSENVSLSVGNPDLNLIAACSPVAVLELIALARAAQPAPAVSEHAPTDIPMRLRNIANTTPHAALILAAAEEIERYYGGMLAWKKTAEKKDADWNAERMARVNERCAARAAVSERECEYPHETDKCLGCGWQAPAASEQTLPEPRQPHSSDPRNVAHAEGWNACLDAVRAALAQRASSAPAEPIGYITTGDAEYNSDGSAEVGGWDIDWQHNVIDAMPEFAVPEATYAVYLERVPTPTATPASASSAPVDSTTVAGAGGLSEDDRDARELAHADQSPVRVTNAELAAFHRFCECAEDFESGGHDVDKAMMSQLVRIGLLRPAGPGRHMTTKFGDWMRNCDTSTATPASAQPAEPRFTALEDARKQLDDAKRVRESRGERFGLTAPASAQPAEQSFPERDQSKPAEQQGMFRKFDVRRVDGSDQPGGKHFGCRYFVLDLTHDQHAPAAMRAYATACAATHPQLATDIAAEFGAQPVAAVPADPVAWIRYRTDGCYEGPIMHSAMEEVRIRSGAWTPLYAGVASAVPVSQAEPTAWIAYYDSVKSQNVARDHQEKADIEHIAKVMNMAGTLTWEELFSHAAPVAAAPAGWKLVPLEPAPEQQQAGFDTPGAHGYNASYRAMVAAAPAAPVAQANSSNNSSSSVAPPVAADDATQAARDVLAERRRQVEAEGMTNDGDDRYHAAELPRAAASYILNGANDEAPAIWPWAKSWWKPRDARANYVRAGALILAEIERIDRAAMSAKQEGA